MPTDHHAEQSLDDAVQGAVHVGQVAIGEREANPTVAGSKPTTSPEAQRQIEAITAELAAAGVTIRWR